MRSNALVGEPLEFSLRADAPVPGIVTESWLHFVGFPLIEAEEAWNDPFPGGPRYGEIMNRVAIYGVVDTQHRWQSGWLRWLGGKNAQRRFTAFVGEVARYNPRVVMVIPDRQRNGPNPLPLFSRAERFSSVSLAIEWISMQPIVVEGSLRLRLEEGSRRVRRELGEGGPEVTPANSTAQE